MEGTQSSSWSPNPNWTVVFGLFNGSGSGAGWAGGGVFATVVFFLGGVVARGAAWTQTTPVLLLRISSRASLGSVEAISTSPSRANERTARWLRGPQMPSAAPGLQPARRSSFWSEMISGVLVDDRLGDGFGQVTGPGRAATWVSTTGSAGVAGTMGAGTTGAGTATATSTSGGAAGAASGTTAAAAAVGGSAVITSLTELVEPREGLVDVDAAAGRCG